MVAAAAFAAQAVTIDFNNEKIGQPPGGFSMALTGGGQPGKWAVMKDDESSERGNVLAQTDADPIVALLLPCIYSQNNPPLRLIQTIPMRTWKGASIIWLWISSTNGFM